MRLSDATTHVSGPGTCSNPSRRMTQKRNTVSPGARQICCRVTPGTNLGSSLQIFNDCGNIGFAIYFFYRDITQPPVWN